HRRAGEKYRWTAATLATRLSPPFAIATCGPPQNPAPETERLAPARSRARGGRRGVPAPRRPVDRRQFRAVLSVRRVRRGAAARLAIPAQPPVLQHPAARPRVLRAAAQCRRGPPRRARLARHLPERRRAAAARPRGPRPARRARRVDARRRAALRGDRGGDSEIGRASCRERVWGAGGAVR